MATPTTTPTKSLANRVSDLERRVQQLSTDIDDHISKERALITRIKQRHGMMLLQSRSDEFSLPSVGGHPFDEPPASLVTITDDDPEKEKSSPGLSSFAQRIVVIFLN